MQPFHTQISILEDQRSFTDFGFVAVLKQKKVSRPLFTIFATVREFYGNQGGQMVTHGKQDSYSPAMTVT